MGQVVGQPIGGFLSHPERHWPKAFAGKFWAKYPFSLPCFVGAGFALCAVSYAAIVLEEVRFPFGYNPLTSHMFLLDPRHQESSPPFIEVFRGR
jgi:hypothetical protein